MSACETNFIYKEVPTWAVDWNNKTFVVLNTIEVLEEVFVWWAPYRTISSIAWKTITLNEAPPATSGEGNVDYFYTIT